MLNKNLRGYVNYKFSSGSETGQDYISFQTKMRNDLRKQAEENNMELENDSKTMSTEKMLEYVKNFDGFHDHRKSIQDMIQGQVNVYKKELKIRTLEV